MHLAGEGEDWGERLPGSRGVLASRPHTKMTTRQRNQAPEDAGRWRNTQGGRGRDTRKNEPPTMGETLRGQQGPGCGLRVAKGGRTDAGNGGRRRHAEKGAETSGGGW